MKGRSLLRLAVVEYSMCLYLSFTGTWISTQKMNHDICIFDFLQRTASKSTVAIEYFQHTLSSGTKPHVDVVLAFSGKEPHVDFVLAFTLSLQKTANLPSSFYKRQRQYYRRQRFCRQKVSRQSRNRQRILCRQLFLRADGKDFAVIFAVCSLPSALPYALCRLQNKHRRQRAHFAVCQKNHRWQSIFAVCQNEYRRQRIFAVCVFFARRQNELFAVCVFFCRRQSLFCR